MRIRLFFVFRVLFCCSFECYIGRSLIFRAFILHYYLRYDNVYYSVYILQRPNRGTFTLFSHLYSMSCPSELILRFQSFRHLLRLPGS